MSLAPMDSYLSAEVKALQLEWPRNATFNLVFHGHSVPAGYFATPQVQTFDAYPHLLHQALKTQFPNAVINCIVTAIGGENSEQGAARFSQVLNADPKLLTLDYSLNDRGIGPESAQAAWRSMIERALAQSIKVILLTPSPEASSYQEPPTPADQALIDHGQQVRLLADEYAVGLVDSFALFAEESKPTTGVQHLLSWVNHPNRLGHQLIASALSQWFAVPKLKRSL